MNAIIHVGISGLSVVSAQTLGATQALMRDVTVQRRRAQIPH
jgi:hypothetical protein